jgi:hypothetical protein
MVKQNGAFPADAEEEGAALVFAIFGIGGKIKVSTSASVLGNREERGGIVEAVCGMPIHLKGDIIIFPGITNSIAGISLSFKKFTNSIDVGSLPSISCITNIGFEK